MTEQQPPPYPHPGPGAAPAPYGQPSPPPGRRSNLAMVIGAIVLAVALLAGGGYLLVTKVVGGGEEEPDGRPGTGAGQGELPEQQPLDAPAVIDDVGQANGLTCHDEATTALQVRGCYLIEKGHLVTLRFAIADGGAIAKFTLTVLHNDTSPTERAAEVTTIVDPVLAELPISEADRTAIAAALKGDKENVSGDTEWGGGAEGRFTYHFGRDTTSLSVGEKSTEFVLPASLTDDPQPVFDELTARGWQCETEDISVECTDGKAGKVVGSLSMAGQPNGEPRLVEFRVWFNGQQPVVDEPRMTDAYEALAKAGTKGEVLASGLRMLADGEKQFFHSDVEFYRGDSYYQVRGVQFN